MISMKRPSRGERESVTTTRYRGRLFEPSRLSRITTATFSPPHRGEAGQAPHAPHPTLHGLELLHHLPQLRVLLEQPVDVLHGRPAAARDALAARAVDELGIVPLGGRHRRDDRVEAAEVVRLVVERDALELLAERKHAEDLVERPELAHLTELLAEVVERERVLPELLRELLGLCLVHRLLRLLDERQHVAHAEDARGEPVRMERLERVHLLADTDEGDRR